MEYKRVVVLKPTLRMVVSLKACSLHHQYFITTTFLRHHHHHYYIFIIIVIFIIINIIILLSSSSSSLSSSGMFSNGKANGFCKKIHSNGDIFNGFFQNDVMTGYGEYRWIDGNHMTITISN